MAYLSNVVCICLTKVHKVIDIFCQCSFLGQPRALIKYHRVANNSRLAQCSKKVIDSPHKISSEYIM